MKIDINKFRVKAGNKISLSDYKTDYTCNFSKIEGKEELKANVEELAELQKIFYADNRYSLLIIFQASDAAGKDGAIRHVLSGVNPQGCKVTSFKSPSKIENQHDYLWRHYKELPEKGMWEVFNRSHYENVLIRKVHPGYVLSENIMGIDSVDKVDKSFWKERYDQINNFEKHIHQTGTIILKFFLHLSKDEQKERFMERLNNPEKNWKFNSGDLKERKYWDKYTKAYEEMLSKTSTKYAPWHIIPADKKYFTRMAIGEIIIDTLKRLDLKYPIGEGIEELAKAKESLMNE